MRNYLKKDDNMPYEYNRAVTYFRIAAAIIAAIIVILLTYIFVYTPPKLTYLENRNYTVTNTYEVKRTGSVRGGSNKYRYWLTLRNDETEKEHEWAVSEKVFNMYTEGEKVSLPVHTIENTKKVFISLENNTDSKAAQKEFYKRYPTTEMKIYMYTLMTLIVAVLGILAAGEKELIRANSHVFIPKEIPDNSENLVKQPDYDDIFDKNGRL